MGRLSRFAALLLLTVGAVSARLALEPEAGKLSTIRDPGWLPSGKLLRIASLGQRLAVADLYWLKLVQYVGERVMAKNSQWDALYPLGDLVTDLDPRFAYAYQITGSDLSGLARLYPESDRILEKGMRNLPEVWALPFTYSVNKFLYEGQFDVAAAYARRAAEVGHRPHLALLAANLALVADRESEYRAAAAFLEESISQADQPELKEELAQRLTKVKTYEVLSRIERAVASFQQRGGRLPKSLDELVLGSFLPELPRDPAGGQIEYDPNNGGVRSSVLGPRRPLRVDKQ
jgi:hypothetical protein